MVVTKVGFLGALLLGLPKTLLASQEQRGLMPGMEMGYGELSCNTNTSPQINTDECLAGATPLSTLLGDNIFEHQVTIPCGTCYTVDYTNGETVPLPSGLNVLGRLHFPSTANVTLETTSVIVQGLWSMTTPDVGNTVTIRLYGTEDVTVYPHDYCCSDDTTCDSECMNKANMASKPFAVVGGQLDIRAIDTECPSWTTLKSFDETTKTIAVDSTFASCLEQGDELVVAGDERGNYGDVIYTVASVTGESVVVNEDILRNHATEAGPGEAMFAAEVAKLTRRVVFEGVEEEEKIGAHSIIFHTPDVVQTIQGVSFRGFGQAGRLGRYPIHFHKSDDTHSLVSKNVIRDSHQRCVFIHNTNFVTIDNNVAHNIRGHCYATETGIEHGNAFTKNLAVAAHKLTVSGNGQSDDPVKANTGSASGNAVFWIRNMMNTFVGNRVAGCAHSGFWLEMKDKKGNQLNDDSFKDNVAHGCDFGLLTYKHGWTPSEPANFKNMLVYKNNNGFKMHFTGNLKLTNFTAADNIIYRYGFGNTGVDVEDSTFIGLSDDARNRLDWSCPNTVDGIYASFNTWVDSNRRQIYFKNVEFRNFGCSSKAISWYMDDRFSNKNMGDPVSMTNISFTGTTLEQNYPALKCGASHSHNWFMEDEEGALGQGTGFIIKDNAQMRAFLNGCEPLQTSSCTAMCQGACIRLVHIEPIGLGPFQSLTLTDQATQVSYEYSVDTLGATTGKFALVLPKATYLGDFKDENGNSIIPSSVKIDTFAEPACQNFVEETDFVFQTSECAGWFPAEGDKVIYSNGFEGDSSGGVWGGSSTSSYSPGAVGEKASAMTYSVTPGSTLPALRLGITGTKTNACVGAGQQLAVYFKAKLLNMTDNDSPIECTPGIDCPTGRFRARQDNPDGGVYCNGWYNLPRKPSAWDKDEFNQVSTLFTIPASCIGTTWKYLFLDITMGKGYPADTVKMIVDDVRVVLDEGQYTSPPTYFPTEMPTPLPTTAMPTYPPTEMPTPLPTTAMPTYVPTEMPTPLPTTAMPTFPPTTQCEMYFPNGEEKILLNQGFDTTSGGTWGGASTTQISPGASGDGKATSMTYTVDPGHMLPAIRLDVGYKNQCVRGGMELNVSFKAKLLDMIDPDNLVDCTPGSNCPTARFRARQNNPAGGTYCNGWYHIPRPTTPWVPGEWNTISTVWTVPSQCIGTSWAWLLFDITQGSGYPGGTVELQVDDVRISVSEGQYTPEPTHLPTAMPTYPPTEMPTPLPTTAMPTLPPTPPPPTDAPTLMPTPPPTTQCEAYFPNGEEKILMNQGFDSTSGGTWGGASTTQVTPGASGDGKASSMTYTVTPGNMLPALRMGVSYKNQCVRGGMQLNVSFKAKLLDMIDPDNLVDCTPGSNCPTARFRARQNNPAGGVYCNGWYHIPRPTTPWVPGEWNTISTVWTVPSRCIGTSWAWLLFDITQGSKYPGGSVEMLVDDVFISVKED